MGQSVSTAELAVPDSARKQYAEAQKSYRSGMCPEQSRELEKAVESRRNLPGLEQPRDDRLSRTPVQRAEGYFRRALKADPSAFRAAGEFRRCASDRGKVDEAYQFNLYSVLTRSTDALANSQLGMNYFALGKVDLARSI